ncbi:MAG: hypothetical protein KME17_28875 [Cyanosarcina radialis HA8281-LM2]|jgi:hypothetical protein|nr:hypothetical protein [Cyanosarcina radialis HA8281-LM2]
MSNKFGKALAIAASAVCLAPSMSLAAPPPAYQVYSDAGSNPAAIQDTVDVFRAALGEPNNGNAVGQQAAGRREINWDAPIVPFKMPGNFFNTVVTRGAEFKTNVWSRFRVSNPVATDATAPSGGDNEFSSINRTYPHQFQTFSPNRLFTPIGTNVTEVKFFVSGTKTPATVKGFGAVFTDVDLPNSSKLEFYDRYGNLLLTRWVKPGPQGLSFLGATFKNGNLFRVKITSGNTPVGPNDNPYYGVDIAVLDDFLYGEPKKLWGY